MLSRKEELERKKAKLQAMRDEKKKKEGDRVRKKEEVETLEGHKDVRAETDQLLKDLGLTTVDKPKPTAVQPPIDGSQPVSSSAASTGSQDSGDAAQLSACPSPRRIGRLGLSKVTQTNILPKEQVTYTKQTQTPSETIDNKQGCSFDSEFSFLVYPDYAPSTDEEGDMSLPETPPILKHHHLPHVEPVKPAEGSNDEPPAEEEVVPPRELSEEEQQQVMKSEEFARFFERASKVVERALCEDSDILKDYAGSSDNEGEGEKDTGARLSLNRTFFDERWSKHRCVTSMDWSTQYPELLVTSYNQNGDATHEPEGVVVVWNQKFKKTTPEYVFHCQSAVMSATFAKFHPNLVIGGTYSGQIVVWDNRLNKRTPVQRSPLSAAAHTHPVYCVNVVGSQNAHNLVSVSTDGKFCTWSLDMLSQPQESMELQHKQTKAVAVTCMCFPYGDVNNFIVGSEEGLVYTACRHGSKTGVLDMFEGHQSPVTGIDCHLAQGQVDFSHLFVTSSFDWTVKLWSQKDNRPLYSFEDNGDYVYDVRWSPIHPALFATVDGMGRLDLWNLNTDTEVPVASINMEDGAALNHVRWSQSGHQLAVGDDMGKVSIYDVGEQVAVPKNDEWSRLVHTLQELKNNQADAEDVTSTSNTGSPMPIR
ncbi:PREDICTED: cytoplasmic dynein 1 intermediate chain 2-like isoform X3 [Priapulus caudatus]|uniref:Cytoplasmic dynein 1 intermediate chain 2-like isoform X3 n=1 Tax=Priapulus caudatus TaxID=37621 RepID=A0ABM1DSY6_PRICU|nr:PREDICTED: cytoplasmic dynein 1 intermediate chain 2-like isoform X3 [Priapulus caudatus]